MRITRRQGTAESPQVIKPGTLLAYLAAPGRASSRARYSGQRDRGSSSEDRPQRLARSRGSSTPDEASRPLARSATTGREQPATTTALSQDEASVASDGVGRANEEEERSLSRARADRCPATIARAAERFPQNTLEAPLQTTNVNAPAAASACKHRGAVVPADSCSSPRKHSRRLRLPHDRTHRARAGADPPAARYRRRANGRCRCLAYGATGGGRGGASQEVRRLSDPPKRDVERGSEPCGRVAHTRWNPTPRIAAAHTATKIAVASGPRSTSTANGV
jgi:hypothetical protein